MVSLTPLVHSIRPIRILLSFTGRLFSHGLPCTHFIFLSAVTDSFGTTWKLVFERTLAFFILLWGKTRYSRGLATQVWTNQFSASERASRASYSTRRVNWDAIREQTIIRPWFENYAGRKRRFEAELKRPPTTALPHRRRLIHFSFWSDTAISGVEAI